MTIVNEHIIDILCVAKAVGDSASLFDLSFSINPPETAIGLLDMLHT